MAPGPSLTDSVDKVADERVEALYWSAWHATSISFSQRPGWSGITLTLPTSRDERNLPVRWWSPDVVGKRFKVLRDSREVELVASTGEAT